MPVRPLRAALAGLVAVGLVVAGALVGLGLVPAGTVALAGLTTSGGTGGGPDAGAGDGDDDDDAATPTATATAGPTGAAAAPPTAEPSPPPPDPRAVADAAAGVRAAEVPQVGAGRTTVVPGTTPATPGERPWSVRVEVEEGLPADGAAFAGFVMATLADPRGWARDGWSFSRTDGPADVTVVLASPDTSAAMCRPLDTGGTLSCRNGDRVVLTWYRWVNGHEDFGADITAYRQYVVNHEVGHSLGHGHESCPGAGQLAPVMQQQSKGTQPCRYNPWPYP